MSDVRFIVIAVPPPPVADVIQAIRKPLCNRYGADWAVQYPPHVTLRTGLLVPDDKRNEVIDAFARIASSHTAFELCTSTAACDYMTYEGEEHFFLYLPVVKDTPLSQLNQDLLSYREFRKSDKIRFDPHLTLFWGDLPERDERELCAAVSNKSAPWGDSFSWLCDRFAFYAWQDDHWAEKITFFLASGK